jgi:YggT family protein
LTEPALRPLRKLAPPYKVGVDLSPLIAVLIILFLEYALVANLRQFGYSLR